MTRKDSIYIDCPNCGMCQTIKVGAAKKISTTFDLDSASKEDIKELKSKAPFKCTKCFSQFKIKSRMIPYRYTTLVS